MARSIWTGSISFGLVNVPVKAFSATRDHTVHFNQLEKKSGARIRYKTVSDKSGREVDADDIELGYELSKGHYVTLDRDELDDLRPESTRTIDVGDFVALDEIDPVFYDHTYWLAPDGECAGKSYRLLQAAMDDQQRVGIGSVVMRNKQYLAAIRPLDGALAMSTMRFADEVIARSDVEGLSLPRSKPSDKEMKLARQIVDSLSTDWDPKRYHDTYTEELHDLLDRKAKGKEIVSEPDADEDEGAKVLDLMAALQASVDSAKRGKGGTRKRSAKRPAAKRAGAKKAPAKRKATAKQHGTAKRKSA